MPGVLTGKNLNTEAKGNDHLDHQKASSFYATIMYSME